MAKLTRAQLIWRLVDAQREIKRLRKELLRALTQHTAKKEAA